MASIITATVSSGLTQQADNSGVLQLASGVGNLVTVPSVTGTAMVSGNMPAFSARATTGQSVSSGTFTKVTFGTEDFDTNNNFASSTFTPTVAGYYQVNCTACCYASSTITRAINALYKNGSVLERVSDIQTGAGTFITTSGSALVYMNGTTDYLEVYVWINGSGSLQVSTATIGESSRFSACLARAA